MRKFIGVTFLFFILIFQLEAANKEQDINQVVKLAATAKIWGFLKYYHPTVANGSYDWDSQLFERLKEVEKVKSKKDLSEFFLEWIESLGEVPKLDSFENPEENFFIKNFNLSWIESGPFNKKLQKKLRHIEKNRFKGEHFYVSTADQVHNAIFINEKEYIPFNWEEKNLRLLALFRYWNQVEYFFPYKYQMDENWDQVLKRLLPLFIKPASELDYQLAMLELVNNLDDAHAYLITPQLNKRTGFYWAPVELEIINDKPVVVDYLDKILAEKDDWKLGDVLLAVNAVPVSEILREEEPYLSGSNLRTKYRNIHLPLLNGNTDSTEIEILRDGKKYKKIIKRFYRREFKPHNSKDKWKFLDERIGYVDLGQLEREDVSKMFDDFKNADGIIIDARKYPRGTWYALANRLHEDDYEIAKSLIPVLNYPGKFKFTESLKIEQSNTDLYRGKVILLINQFTQSQGEYTVMALETAPNVLTVGTPTAGANGNTSDVSFIGGFSTYMSGLGVFYPDGRETQRFGIHPDIKVKRTLSAITNGEDEILNKALELLTK